MGLFGSSALKRVTKEEWEEIRLSLYGKLDDKEKNELEKFFRADLNESGDEYGISKAEFDSGMSWLRQNKSKHEFEDDDLALIEKYFEEHLKD